MAHENGMCHTIYLIFRRHICERSSKCSQEFFTSCGQELFLQSEWFRSRTNGTQQDCKTFPSMGGDLESSLFDVLVQMFLVKMILHGYTCIITRKTTNKIKQNKNIIHYSILMTKESNNKTYDNDTIYFMGREPILQQIIEKKFTTYALVLMYSFTKPTSRPQQLQIAPSSSLN